MEINMNGNFLYLICIIPISSHQLNHCRFQEMNQAGDPGYYQWPNHFKLNSTQYQVTIGYQMILGFEE
jgi:hypothetical protein